MQSMGCAYISNTRISVVKAILEFRSSLQHLSIRATETLGAISRRTWGMREKAGRRALVYNRSFPIQPGGPFGCEPPLSRQRQ